MRVLALGRREMLLWLAVVLLCQQLFAIPADSIGAYLDGLQSHLAAKSIFSYIAWFAVLSLIILRTMLPQESVYDYALAFGVIGLLCAIVILVFSFTSQALNSVLRLIPRRFSESKAVRILERLHEAYASLATDRRRIATFSGLTLVEHIIVILCYGLVARALEE